MKAVLDPQENASYLWARQTNSVSKSIKVAIAGINGKMGRASLGAITRASGLEVVAAFGKSGAAYVGKSVACFLPGGDDQALDKVLIQDNLEACLAATPDVLLEFTRAESCMEHARYALEKGVRPVIGTSGLCRDDFKDLEALSEKHGVPCMVVPNFSIGAVLMMEFARQAGAHYRNVEIVEMHGTKKLDAPSGTAAYTASKLEEAEHEFNPREVEEREILKGVRGGETDRGVRIHSLRLPGLISHQEVIFAAPGEMLTIRHNSFNADCFEKGIVLSVRSVMEMSGFSLGLESLL